MISRLFSWLMFFVIIGVFVFVFQTQVADGLRQVYSRLFPCTVPVTYKLGSIDTRFGIATSTLVKDLATASKLWNSAAGKTLIKEDEKNGYVTVSLVYDSRQEMTQRLRKLGIRIRDDRASYDELKAKYDATYSKFQSLKMAFEAHVASYESARDAYEKQVAYWNGRGGAPRSEYEQLQRTQSSLNAQSQTLKNEQDSVNDTAQNVNDLARALNQLIASLNLDVQRYNTTGQENGASFEQGLYERSLGVETITIFEYENNALLTRVLAHELGHALGLDHVEDTDAIMYYLNEGDAIGLTAADKAELKTICKL